MFKKISLITTMAILLTNCVTSSLEKKSQALIFKLETFETWGELSTGKPIVPGGLSGLHYQKENSTKDEFYLWSLADRGVNGMSYKDESGKTFRPFYNPKFQPRIFLLKVNRVNKKLIIEKTIKLTTPNGHAMTGLPPHPANEKNGYDEIAIDSNKKTVVRDIYGIDPEGITMDNDGNFWICEEYRPSIMKFSPKGKLIKIFSPQGSDKESKYIKPVLSVELKNRQLNRGFEGIAYAQGKIYAMMQSPLDFDKELKPSFLRLVELDPEKHTTRDYKIALPNLNIDKVGDLTYVPKEDQFYFVLQNSKTNTDGTHIIFRFKRTELVTFDKIIQPEQTFDLNQYGFGFEKAEGLAYIGNGEWAVANDNDFNVAGDNQPSVVGIIKP